MDVQSEQSPFVSLIVAVRNEAAHISECLASLSAQDYPNDRLEIIVADGESDDETLNLVAKAAAVDPRISFISNPDQLMAAGLNLAIGVARGEIVGSIIGHSVVAADYVSRAVRELRRTGAWSVGGAIVRESRTPLQRAIAAATGSPIGVGNARHNYATTAGWVESVFPGLWPRHVFDTVGRFDPAFPYNEDNELSLRIRKAGGRIWYDPALRISYFPRATLSGLFNQYRRYARGRVGVFRKHRSGLGARHLAPVALVLGLLLGGLAALAWPLAASLWLIGAALYLGVVIVGSAWFANGANVALVATAVVTMHIAYGIGVLQGLADGVTGGRES